MKHDKPMEGRGALIDLLIEKRIVTKQDLAETAERLVLASDHKSMESPYLADALMALLENFSGSNFLGSGLYCLHPATEPYSK